MTPTPKDLSQTLYEAVNQTFEAMAFIMVAPYHGKQSPPEGTDSETGPPAQFLEEPIQHAQISVLKPGTGSMAMEIPQSLALEVTKNLYGWMEEENPPESMVRDALGELINTMAGQVMTQLTPADEMFELGLPSVENLQAPSPPNDRTFSFTTDAHIFALILEGDVWDLPTVE